MISAELILPCNSRDTTSISQAIAMEHGEVVYEILSRRKTAEGLKVSYRAIPTLQWKSESQKPKRQWTIFPQAEREKAKKRIHFFVEVVMLSVLGILLLTGIFCQAFQILGTQRYLSYLESAHTSSNPSSSAASIGSIAPVAPQVAWVSTMNTVSRALAKQGVIIRQFDFASGNYQIAVEKSRNAQNIDVEDTLNQSLGRQVAAVKEDSWVWRD